MLPCKVFLIYVMFAFLFMLPYKVFMMYFMFAFLYILCAYAIWTIIVTMLLYTYKVFI